VKAVINRRTAFIDLVGFYYSTIKRGMTPTQHRVYVDILFAGGLLMPWQIRDARAAITMADVAIREGVPKARVLADLRKNLQTKD